jgi:hypothetical protein
MLETHKEILKKLDDRGADYLSDVYSEPFFLRIYIPGINRVS